MKVLFIVAHPHYPAQYTAGTVANHVKRGDEVYVVSVTHGEKLTGLHPEEEVKRINVEEMQKAADLLGIKEVRYLDGEDTGVKVTDELREQITNAIREIKPDILITHWKDDTHPDIRATAEMVEDCAFFAMLSQGRWAKKYSNHFTPRVYAFEMTGYSRNFVPDYYIDVTDCMDIKREAANCFQLHLKADANDDLNQWMYPLLTASARWANDAQKECKNVEVFRRIWIHETLHKATKCLPVE